MANENFMINVAPDFNLYRLVDDLVKIYQGRGMQVNVMQVGEGVCIDFNDGNDGFKKYIGLGASVKANMMVNNGSLIVNFTDVDWTGKIVAFIVGWFLCWIPWVTCAIGLFKQLDMPKKIGNDIRMLEGGNMQQNQGMYGNGGVHQTPVANDNAAYGNKSFCPVCGKPNDPNARFCSGCGTPRN